MRDDRALTVIAAAGAIDVAALGVLCVQPEAWLLVGLVHVAAAGAVLRLRGVEPTRRLLAAAMMFCLPPVGPAMAMLAVRLRGRGGDDLLAGHKLVARSASGAELAARLTAGGPACEALLAVDAETRHVAVSALQREADARAITLLRWSLAQPDPDLALEAALALEELSARYAERSAEACALAERQPSRASALAAAEVIASAIHNGLADPALLPAIAAQARAYYRLAAQLDEPRAAELAGARARLELAMLDPDAALALIEPVLDAGAGDEPLRELYRDAAHAARRFDLLAPCGPAQRTPATSLPAEAERTSISVLRPLASLRRDAALPERADLAAKPRERAQAHEEAEPRQDRETRPDAHEPGTLPIGAGP
jgi:hypothetical protein